MSINDPDKKTLSVLYVEDDLESREDLCEIFRSRYLDVQLLVAENGAAGLELFRLNQPEIVISDINMPEIDGVMMAAEIRSINPATEIIFLTAYSDVKYLIKAIEIGASHFILKPVNIKLFFEIFDKAILSASTKRLLAEKNQEILQLNKYLTRKTEELKLANEELESFDYTLAHDLRTPLITISGFTQRLLDKHESALDDSGKECLRAILGEVNRLNCFISALLKFSVHARKQIEKKWTSLTDIALEVSSSLLAQDSGRKVTFCIADGINGYCEPNLMRIVLENLIGNAWKFSAQVADARIEFGVINNEEDLVYFVRDNGAGFDTQESHKLFIPFKRLQSDTENDGFGIGLATASRIILRHGGRIWGEGEKGKGATIYFSL